MRGLSAEKKLVSVEPFAEEFTQWARQLGIAQQELAVRVARLLGYVVENLAQGDDLETAETRAAYGVLIALGLREDGSGDRRVSISRHRGLKVHHALALAT